MSFWSRLFGRKEEERPYVKKEYKPAQLIEKEKKEKLLEEEAVPIGGGYSEGTSRFTDALRTNYQAGNYGVIAKVLERVSRGGRLAKAYISTKGKGYGKHLILDSERLREDTQRLFDLGAEAYQAGNSVLSREIYDTVRILYDDLLREDSRVGYDIATKEELRKMRDEASREGGAPRKKGGLEKTLAILGLGGIGIFLVNNFTGYAISENTKAINIVGVVGFIFLLIFTFLILRKK